MGQKRYVCSLTARRKSGGTVSGPDISLNDFSTARGASQYEVMLDPDQRNYCLQTQEEGLLDTPSCVEY